MYPTLVPFFKQRKLQPLYSSIIGYENGHPGLLRINRSADDILRLCNGQNQLEDIVNCLFDTTREDRSILVQYVQEFMEMAEKNKMITYNQYKATTPIILPLSGSAEYWSIDSISIELTEKCPLKCKHCFVEATMDKKIQLSDFLEYKLFSELENISLEQIQLTGGEPMLHPKFWSLLEKSTQLGATVHVFTSGYVFTDELENNLKNFNPKQVFFQVSLDGMHSYHNEFRGASDAFEKSILFIKKVIASGFCVTVATCIDEQSYEEMKELCEFVKRIGVARIRLGGISSQGRALPSEIVVDTAKRIKLKQFQHQLSVEVGSENFSVYFIEDTEKMVKSEYCNNCGIGQVLLNVKANGDINPCLMSEIVIGNLEKSSLQDIQKRFSRTFEKIDFPRLEICQGCDKFTLCENCIVQGMINSEFTDSCAWRIELQKLESLLME
ncbi:radical SAM protein [Bengtsoniella intestinalis]|uniref:radical SAM protein n=1 Tax=Bengtsoniella intestinalis TaxID=3073143 RepID=UPI00391EFA23